jgi:hypothetical protein
MRPNILIFEPLKFERNSNFQDDFLHAPHIGCASANPHIIPLDNLLAS